MSLREFTFEERLGQHKYHTSTHVADIKGLYRRGQDGGKLYWGKIVLHTCPGQGEDLL